VRRFWVNVDDNVCDIHESMILCTDYREFSTFMEPGCSLSCSQKPTLDSILSHFN
jgi:hypothetical protein